MMYAMNSSNIEYWLTQFFYGAAVHAHYEHCLKRRWELAGVTWEFCRVAKREVAR